MSLSALIVIVLVLFVLAAAVVALGGNADDPVCLRATGELCQ